MPIAFANLASHGGAASSATPNTFATRTRTQHGASDGDVGRLVAFLFCRDGRCLVCVCPKSVFVFIHSKWKTASTCTLHAGRPRHTIYERLNPSRASASAPGAPRM